MAEPSAATSIARRSSTKNVQCGLPMLQAAGAPGSGSARVSSASATGTSRQPVSGVPISTVIRPFVSLEHTR
ncbi:hypothetical protein WK41_04370 [Burkholderia cepacia]|nr:hypothetical protein WK41_04370 [Burkholderia cepacia]